ncbi:MAG TPA: MATE family efflux transporter [Acidimicrobiales bacterium]|nr:MATE family efflux transporter [Acidimicrobiales bacterium]
MDCRSAPRSRSKPGPTALPPPNEPAAKFRRIDGKRRPVGDGGSKAPVVSNRAIWGLAVPALGTLAVEPLYRLTDTAIIGRLGTVPLAGLALAATVLGTLTFLCFFLTTGTTARVAFLTGQGADRAAAEVVPQVLWVAAGLAIILTGLIVGLARPLANFVGGEPAVIDQAVIYLRISALAIPSILVAFVGNGWHRGRSDTRTPLTIVVVANLINVVLEVVLVYGLDLGIAGSAVGTLIAQTVAGAWFLALLVKAVIDHGAGVRPHRTELTRVLRVARQMGLRSAGLLATLALATAVASRISAASLAAHQIAFEVFLFLALSVDALAVAAQALVGTALGRGGGDEARAVGRQIIRMGSIVGAALTVLVLLTSQVIPRVFTSDAAVLDRASVALIGLALMQIPAALAFVLDGILEGASDFGFLQWALLGAMVAFAPFAVGVMLRPELGLAGLWAGLFVWVSTRAALLTIRFRGPAWTGIAS